jgi:hypothetical protein
MCEFCDSLPQGSDRRRQAHRAHADFAGFFSAALIDAAVQQAKAERAARKGTQPNSDDSAAAAAADDPRGEGDVDDDGT